MKEKKSNGTYPQGKSTKKVSHSKAHFSIYGQFLLRFSRTESYISNSNTFFPFLAYQFDNSILKCFEWSYSNGNVLFICFLPQWYSIRNILLLAKLWCWQSNENWMIEFVCMCGCCCCFLWHFAISLYKSHVHSIECQNSTQTKHYDCENCIGYNNKIPFPNVYHYIVAISMAVHLQF